MAVSRPDDVSEAVARVSVGQVLKVDIRRGNAQKHLDVRVEALPDDG
jgi:S1-C subfamily serine protease